MFCGKCGSQISDNANFCDKCGAKMASPEIKTEKNNENSHLENANNEIKQTTPLGKAKSIGRLIIETIQGVAFLFALLYYLNRYIDLSGIILIYLIILVIVLLFATVKTFWGSIQSDTTIWAVFLNNYKKIEAKASIVFFVCLVLYLIGKYV